MPHGHRRRRVPVSPQWTRRLLFREVSMTKDKSLGLKISEVIWEHEPLVAELDMESCARAASEVAGVLGCLVATLTAAYPEKYDELMALITGKVENTAKTVGARAR